MVFPHVLERRRRIADLVDLDVGRGLEVGPLDSPLADRTEHPNVQYVDVVDQAGLRQHYAGDTNVDPAGIPTIDYALTTETGVVSLAEALRGSGPFDWVLASHVVEHVPDLIGWMDALSGVTADGGVLLLIVPDRRFTFDFHRQQTSVGQVLEAHDLELTRPSVRAVFDHFSTAANVPAHEAWAGGFPVESQRCHRFADAVEQVEKARNGEYIDSHVWTWTPSTFRDQLHELGQLGASPYVLTRLIPTVTDEIEFYAVLRRVPRGTSYAEAVRTWAPSDESDEPDESDDGEASRGFLGSTRPEWFDGSTVNATARSEMEALHEELDDVAAECRRLTGENELLAAQVHDVRTSERWRVGGWVLEPAVVARRALRAARRRTSGLRP